MILKYLNYIIFRSSILSMKKYLLVLLLLFPLSTFAIEGTCAWHGGIDCSIGPDWDGSAICMDGWAQSSERYFDQKICVNTPMCTQYLWNQMSDTWDRNEDEAKYNELINRINTLNLEYPLIKIKIQEQYAGRGVTTGAIDTFIDSAQRVNRNSVATSTYEALNLDKKLRNTQIEINKMCINEGAGEQKSLIDAYTSNIVPTKQKDINISDSPYQNIKEKKIYKDIRQMYAVNTDLGCSKMGLYGEDLAMCNAFAEDKNKDNWLSIDRPEEKTVTTQSLLEERAKQETLKNQQSVIKSVQHNTAVKNNTDIIRPRAIINDQKLIPTQVNISTGTPTKYTYLQTENTPTNSKAEIKIKKEPMLKKLSSWFKSLFN